MELSQRPPGSQLVTKEVLADGEYFGALPALGVAHRMGAMLIRAMGQVECFAISDEAVRSVLACAPRPAGTSSTSRACTAERSSRGCTANMRSSKGWGGRPGTGAGKVRPTSSAVLPATLKSTPRKRPSASRSGVAPDSSTSDEDLNIGNIMGGDWVSVQVHKVHADSWVDAGRSEDSMAMQSNTSVTPTRGSATESPSTTPCKPSTPHSRSQRFRRQVYSRSSARPCSRKADDYADAVASVPGTPAMTWRRPKGVSAD